MLNPEKKKGCIIILYDVLVAKKGAIFFRNFAIFHLVMSHISFHLFGSTDGILLQLFELLQSKY